MRRALTWTTDDIPNLTGRVALVTGGNTGLGYRTSLELARKGAQVLIACRSLDKGNQACDLVKVEVPDATVEAVRLDLLDPDVITECAAQVNRNVDKLDILVNNAGVVNLPALQRGPNGHEMHMATNHFGHFALTARVLPSLGRASEPRVVTLSSLAYRQGTIDFDDLDWRKRSYAKLKAYGDSKLANLYFTRSLQLWFDNNLPNAKSLAAHPGLTGTERQQTSGVGGVLSRWLASSVADGVRPQLMAATSDDVQGGEFYGPRWGLRGAPTRIQVALDLGIGQRLWEVSAAITGVEFPA